jgi:arylsulfatase A-like enzyme
VVTSLVSTLDLVPTLLPLLNIRDEAERVMRGVNVLVKNPAHDVYSETDYRLFTHKRSITTTDGWKFILTRETGEKELYNLNADFGEQKNVVRDEPQRAYELEQKLLVHLKEVGDTGPWRLGCLAVYADQCK